MNWIVFATPCAIILMGVWLRFFPYSEYIPPNKAQRYVSHHGMNLSWIDLTEKQWAQWQKVLLKKYILIFAGVDFIINLIVWHFVVPFDIYFVIAVSICLFIAALIVSVIKAEKYTS